MLMLAFRLIWKDNGGKQHCLRFVGSSLWVETFLKKKKHQKRMHWNRGLRHLCILCIGFSRKFYAKACLLFNCFLVTKRILKALFSFIPWLLNFSDLPNYGSNSRKRYILRLLLKCLVRSTLLPIDGKIPPKPAIPSSIPLDGLWHIRHFFFSFCPAIIWTWETSLEDRKMLILWCRTDICGCKLSGKVSLMLDNPFPVPSLCKLNHINDCFIQISTKITCKQFIPFRESNVFCEVILGVLGRWVNFNITWRFLLRRPMFPDYFSVPCGDG